MVEVGKQLEQMKTESKQGLKLVDGPLDELNLEELLMLHVEMIELSEKLKKHHKERLVKDDTSSSMSVGGSVRTVDFGQNENLLDEDYDVCKKVKAAKL
ncbi:hypothetical protein V6N13_112196 [Hibiscus sabdariffa]